MYKVCLLRFIVPLFFLTACKENIDISSICEKDRKDNYIIKWEVFPDLKKLEKINIYASSNDSVFPSEPQYSSFVSSFISIVPASKNIFREFFKLKINNSASGIVSNRFFSTKNIQNLRDIGGCFTINGQQMKWGRVYRSGELCNLTQKDEDVLDSLKIKTVIDFRNKKHSASFPDKLDSDITYIQLPVEVDYVNTDIINRIQDETFLKGDAIIYMQDAYRNIIENYSDQYAKFFDVLSEPNNYPILFHCGWGKDRTGLASYFLLKILNIETGYIEDDYMLSNIGIDKGVMWKDVDTLSESAQETVIAILMCDISQLRYAISCMKKKSGSVEEYIREELKVTPEKALALQNLLLYR